MRRDTYSEAGTQELYDVLVMAALEDADLLLELGRMLGRGEGGDRPPCGFLLENFDSHDLHPVALSFVHLQACEAASC